MPQYEMEGKNETGFQSLDSFTQAYIEAMFWTSEAPGVSTEEWRAVEAAGEEHPEGSIPCDVGFLDLAPATLTEIITDCLAFQVANKALLTQAYGMTMHKGVPYTESQAGHDFWLTRIGSGAGFYDRGLGEVGDALSATCGWSAKNQFGEVDIYLGDDGKVYIT